MSAPPIRGVRRSELGLAALTLCAFGFVVTRDDSAPTSFGPSAAPRAVDLPDGSTVSVPAHAARILPASTALLDWLAPLVSAERIAAVPNLTEHYAVIATRPEGAALLARPRWVEFQSEAILDHHPDLVLVQAWHDQATRGRLAAQGVPVIALPEPSSWDELAAGTVLLGELVDERERAAALLAELEARRAALAARRAGKAPRVVVYSNYNSGSVGSVTGRGTTMDLCLALAGARNAATARDLVGHADADLELLVALDPDVLVVARDDEGESTTRDYVRATGGLATLRAVRAGHIAELDGRLTGAASHHILECAEALAAELERLGL